MKKLRIVLAGVLLSLPIMALNASSLSTAQSPAGASLSTTHSVTGWCWIYFMGRYIAVPC